jgi:SAD/SRA domain
MMRNHTRKVHGHIKGVPVGMHFFDRRDLAKAGVHGRPAWGIHGTADDGAYAVVLNEGYEDDDDQGETMYVLSSHSTL